jgi:hypothetical protein
LERQKCPVFLKPSLPDRGLLKTATQRYPWQDFCAVDGEVVSFSGLFKSQRPARRFLFFDSEK